MKPHFASTLYVVQQARHKAEIAVTPQTPPAPSASTPVADKPDVESCQVMIPPPGEHLTIMSSDGQVLLEIVGHTSGPKIHLIGRGLRVKPFPAGKTNDQTTGPD